MANIGNIDSIKITQLTSIGSNIAANSLIPVVNMANLSNPITQKSTLQNAANYILNNANGVLFPPASQAIIALSVANAAQPNITSVGTLSINTLNISGGNNGQFLQTNGNGNLNWADAPGGGGNGSPAGANAQIQYNLSGEFGASANLNFNAGSGTLNTPQLMVGGNANIEGTANVTNLNVIANFSIPSITTGPIVSNSSVTANGFMLANGNITSNGHFIGNGALLTGITATATGAGPNTSVQYNANGVFAGDANFAYDYANHVLNVTTSNIDQLTANTVQANHFAGEGGNLSNIQGANVTGAIALATYAGTANAVAVANVIGIGNIATVALNGSSSQVLYGNGQWVAAAGSYGNSNVAAFLENYGSNTITTTGNVTTGLLTVPASDNGSIIFSDNGTDNNGSLKVDGGLNMTLSANSNFYVKQAEQDRLAITDGNTDLMASTNVVIHSNKAGTENKWIFDSSGNLSLPGSANYQVPGLGSNGHFDINSWYPVNISTGDGVNEAISTWNFGWNGTLTFPGNFATIFADTGANQLNIGAGGDGGGYVTINATTDTGIGGSQNVSILTNFGSNGNSFIWNFDDTGNLTVPGNINNANVITASVVNTANINTTFIYANNGIQLAGTSANILMNGGYIIGPSLMQIGNTDNVFVGQNAVLVMTGNSANYIEAALVNQNSTGSGDFTVYVDNGNAEAGYVDMGITGSAYNVPNTGLTQPGDGYFIVAGTPTSGGNLIIATAGTGSNNDIVFGNGYDTGNEVMRFENTLQTFQIKPTTVSNSTTTGALTVAGGVGVGGDLNAGGNIVTGNGSGGNISGVDLLTANYFVGDGSNITNVPISWTAAPVSNTSSGVQGQVAYDSGGNLFICVATNIWSKITGTISW
jgi:hypothetical protein